MIAYGKAAVKVVILRAGQFSLLFQQSIMATGQGVNEAAGNCPRINWGPQLISSSVIAQEIIGSTRYVANLFFDAYKILLFRPFPAG